MKNIVIGLVSGDMLVFGGACYVWVLNMMYAQHTEMTGWQVQEAAPEHREFCHQKCHSGCQLGLLAPASWD